MTRYLVTGALLAALAVPSRALSIREQRASVDVHSTPSASAMREPTHSRGTQSAAFTDARCNIPVTPRSRGCSDRHVSRIGERAPRSELRLPAARVIAV